MPSTKIEGRWRDQGGIESQVLAVLRETLLSHDLTPRLGFGRPPFGGSIAADDQGTPAIEHQARARQALADYLKSVDPTQARLRFDPPKFGGESVRPSIRSTWTSRGVEQTTVPPTTTNEVPIPPRSDEAVAQTPEQPATPPHIPDDTTGEGAGSSQVIQVHNTYLVAQTDEGIVIIDQHALHERILYERFRERILSGALEAQRLLIPPTFDASPTQVQAAEENAELLSQLGIEVSAFGPRSLAVQCLPTLLGEIDAIDFVRDLLDTLGEPERTGGANDTTGHDSRETLLHAALDMMACKAAVKAGDPLTQEEMLELLAQRHLVERSSNCPHGRPTTLQLSTRDLERQFKRV